MQDEIEEYLAQRRAEGLTNASAVLYRKRLHRLMARLSKLGVIAWKAVKAKHLDAVVDEMKDSGLSERTRQAEIIAARCFFRWMVEHGRLLSDPAKHLELPTIREDGPLLCAPLSESDVTELMASLPRGKTIHLRNAAHIELLYSAGLRLGESLALNVSDVDLSEKVLRVRCGKAGKAREVPILAGLLGALKDYICLRRSLLKGPDHGALLLAQNGQRLKMNAFEKYIEKLNKQREGKPRVHPHLFRHSIAVHLLRGGADIRYVQAFLGHDDLESTKVYLRLVPADLRDAYDAAMPEICLRT